MRQRLVWLELKDRKREGDWCFAAFFFIIYFYFFNFV